MELCSLFDARVQADLVGQIRTLQVHVETFIALHQ